MTPRTMPDFPSTPDEDSLEGVLRHLTPLHSRSGLKPRDPNGPDIRWILESAVVALVARFLDHRDLQHHQAYAEANTILGSISLNDVMNAFVGLTAQFKVDPGAANRDRIMNRWETTVLFQRDLLRYVFRDHLQVSRVSRFAEHLRVHPGMPSFGSQVDQLIDVEVDELDRPTQLQIALRAAFPQDPQIRELAQRAHDNWSAEMRGALTDLFLLYGIPVPQEEELDELTDSLGLALEGAYLRRHEQLDESITSIVRLLFEEHTGIPWEDLAEREVQDDAPN